MLTNYANVKNATTHPSGMQEVGGDCLSPLTLCGRGVSDCSLYVAEIAPQVLNIRRNQSVPR